MQSVDANCLVPDFTTIALSAEEPISKALDIVLSAKKKTSYYQPEELNFWVKTINFFAHGDTVGYLRLLTDDQWDSFMQDSVLYSLPLLCKMYLKRLIIQSQRLTKQQILECDFNLGLQFEWSSVEEQINTLFNIYGFSPHNAMEAIMVIKHQPDNEGETLDLLQFQQSYLMMDEISKKMMYDKAKKHRNQFVPYKYHWTIIESIKQENNLVLKWQRNGIKMTKQKLKDDLKKFKMERIKLERKVNNIRYQRKMSLYTECVRGVIGEYVIISSVYILIIGYIRKQQIAITQIIPHEINGVILLYFSNSDGISVSGSKMTFLENYKHQQRITDEDHINVLNELGYTEEMFSQLEDSISFVDPCSGPMEMECVVCYEPPRDYMVLPCCHICLNGDCAEENFPSPHINQICPLCNVDIVSIKQVFYF